MKADLPAQAKRLEDIPNIGPSLASDLRGIGITQPKQLKGKDGLALYRKLNKVTGARHDPCVADTFLAAVHFMDTGEALPWWKFTPKRKQAFQKENHLIR